MTDMISIDRNSLIINKLSINEYYFLRLHFDKFPISKDDIALCGKVDYEYLQDNGFVKITEDGIILREKGNELFKDTRNNFYRFVSTFPIKTPDGRYLSPAGTEGVAINTLKAKWEKIFKKNVLLENRAILVLEAELAYRKRENSLKYMHACEAWLNGADYEKYEYLLEDVKNVVAAENNELM
jgi:hypothetical protein